MKVAGFWIAFLFLFFSVWVLGLVILTRIRELRDWLTSELDKKARTRRSRRPR